MRSFTNNMNLKLVLYSAGAAVVMVILWIIAGIDYDSSRPWRALLINYLFFTSFSAGLIVWPAIVIVSEGEWMGSLERFCRAGLVFSVPSVIILAVLWYGSGKWAPWVNSAEPGFWMNNTFVFTRNIVMLVLFWISGFYFMIKRKTGRQTVPAVILILLYVITFSLAGFDFIMGLNPAWHSMMIGGYFFIVGLYTAVTAWAFISVIGGSPDRTALTDMGKLIVTFCMLTSYLMFSQLLPIWYENLPGETNFVVPLLNLAWRKISYVLLVIIYIGPILLLMTRWSKRNYLYMGIVTSVLLTGLWMEKWWLVSSVFEKDAIVFGWVEVIPALVFAAIIVSASQFFMNYPVTGSRTE